MDLQTGMHNYGTYTPQLGLLVVDMFIGLYELFTFVFLAPLLC